MRKFFIKILLMLLLLFAIFGVFYVNAQKVADVLPQSCVSNDVLNHMARISFEKRDHDRVMETTFSLAEDLQAEDLHLMIADISNFEVFLNDSLFYQFAGSPSSKRMHNISLRDPVEPGGQLTIRLVSPTPMNPLKCLIGSGREIGLYMSVMQTLSTLILGVYIAIIINCLLLYLGKRSEKYLMTMLLFTVSVAVTNILYSTLPIPDFPFRSSLNRGYLNAISKVLCLVVSLELMKLKPFPRREKQYPWILMAATIILVVVFNEISVNVRKMVLDLIGYITVAAVIYACYKERPHADIMMFGTTVSMSIMFYTSFVNYGWVKPCLFMNFIHLTGLYYLCFDLTCLCLVDRIFSTKFEEAEQLILVIEESNRRLDEKVKERTGELETANIRLLQTQAEKNAVMTNLFHDMRNPLFCAVGYTEMIESKYPVAAEETTVLRRQLDSLSHITENLFLMAKLEDRKITFMRQAVNVSELCDVILQEIEPEASTRKKFLSKDLDPELIVTGDGFRLKQALYNVVSNAIQHTPEGTHVQISCHQENGYAIISVEDDGNGISEDAVSHLFDRYYTRSPESTNSGLGLAIAKEIIHAHDGTINVESEVGKGSCFVITLQLRENDSKPDI